jgi:hypothetical protein
MVALLVYHSHFLHHHPLMWHCTPESRASHPQPPLCIATYNIWFDEVHRRARFDAMLDIVLPRGVDPASWPHFVALQEVVAETAAWLFEVNPAPSFVRWRAGCYTWASWGGVVAEIHRSEREASLSKILYPESHALAGFSHPRPLPRDGFAPYDRRNILRVYLPGVAVGTPYFRHVRKLWGAAAHGHGEEHARVVQHGSRPALSQHCHGALPRQCAPRVTHASGYILGNPACAATAVLCIARRICGRARGWPVVPVGRFQSVQRRRELFHLRGWWRRPLVRAAAARPGAYV